MTGIDADVRQATHKGVGRDLEHQAAERLGRLGLERYFLVIRHVRRLRLADVQRGREVTHHCIQKELDALVLERRAAAGRNDLHGDGTLAERSDQLLLRDGLGSFEILVHQGIVALGGCLDELVPPLGDSVQHVLGDVGVLVVHQLLAGLVDDRLAGDQVNDSFEFLFCPDREADRNSGGTELGLDLLDACEEIGTDPVHLVHIGNLRHVVLVCLAPYGLGLRLHAPDSAESCDRTVQDTQRTLHLHREVDVAGSVDQEFRLPQSCYGCCSLLHRDEFPWEFILLHNPIIHSLVQDSPQDFQVFGDGVGG